MSDLRDYDSEKNWWPETHKNISYKELYWIRGRWFFLGMLTMFGILWTVGWVLGL